jgi:hypothetical protein
VAAPALIDRDRLPNFGALHVEFTAETFAIACRRAALQLLDGPRRGWGKRELAEWLTGPYQRLSALDLEPDASLDETGEEGSTGARGSEPPPSTPSLGEDRVTRLLEAMRADVLLVFEELRTPEGVRAFADLAVRTRLVGAAEDEEGQLAYVPRQRPRMSLVDRALSLIAVDVLTNPHDYDVALFQCSRCGLVQFDADARVSGMCRVHSSGILTR